MTEWVRLGCGVPATYKKSKTPITREEEWHLCLKTPCLRGFYVAIIWRPGESCQVITDRSVAYVISTAEAARNACEFFREEAASHIEHVTNLVFGMSPEDLEDLMVSLE